MNEDPLNLDVLFAEFFDKAALMSLLLRYAEELPERLDRLEAAGGAGDWAAAKDMCHALRGSAANFTATVFADQARILERAAAEGAWDESAFRYLREEAARITLYLAQKGKEL